MVEVNSKIQKENKTVVLVSPPSRMMNHYRPPLALMYISGYTSMPGTIVGQVRFRPKTSERLVKNH